MKVDAKQLAGIVPVANGGTGASDAATARANIGAAAPTDTVAKATALAGGVAGNLVYQSAADTTAYVSNGSAGQFLQSNGASAPSFVTLPVDSPFEIGAAIASNAITVTLTKGNWRFRNTTLSNGAGTFVNTATNLTLTISATDSFGLVTASGIQRIVIILFNDAGTLRLAASSLAGGVQLDETNLLSATTTATTSTAIDCGAVVTSKAYRVVGFLEAAFTTGTGWGSLGTVQSVGGQSLTSMSSLGYGQTWQSPSRANGVTYYNTTGKPIIFATTQNNGGSPFNSVQTVNGISLSAYYYTGTGGPGMMIVPPGGSYSASGATLSSWIELR